MTYTVRVDDNFHYMDKEYRRTYGEYAEAALNASTAIVELVLASAYTLGMRAEDRYQNYTSLGDDPFIVGTERRIRSVPRGIMRRRNARCYSPRSSDDD